MTPGDLIVIRLRELAPAGWLVGLVLGIIDGEVFVMWSELPNPTFALHLPAALRTVQSAHSMAHE